MILRLFLCFGSFQFHLPGEIQREIDATLIGHAKHVNTQIETVSALANVRTNDANHKSALFRRRHRHRHRLFARFDRKCDFSIVIGKLVFGRSNSICMLLRLLRTEIESKYL